MKFKVDHDYHIHSHLSLCSGDPEQTTQNILRYAHKNNFKRICLTDHFWDEKVEGAIDWYKPQNLAHVRQSLPLPQEEGIRFFFGVEADMDKFFRLGIAEETFGQFDFVIIPTTHLHMNGFTLENGVTDNAVRAQLWFDRLAALLQKPLPWHKIGIAHLTCSLIGGSDRKAHIDILRLLNRESVQVLFRRIAESGAGVELNFNPFIYNDEELETVLDVYRLAKAENCKFYLGSDAHTADHLRTAPDKFAQIVDLLGLDEQDKFDF